MVVGAARNNIIATFNEDIRHGAGVGNHLPLIVDEILAHRFFKRHGLGCDDMHQWATLLAWEHRAI